MNFTFLLSLSLLAFPLLGQALVIYDSHTASSCVYFLREFAWNCTSMGGHMSSSTWTCQCHNDDWLATMTNCIHDFSNSTQEMEHAYDHIVKRCNVRAATEFNVSYLSNYQVQSQSLLQPLPANYNVSDNVEHPFSISAGIFHKSYKNFRDYNYFISMCQRLGWACLGYWVGIFGLTRIYKTIGYKFTPPAVKNYTNKYLVWKADWFLFGLNRLEAIICFFFFVMVLLCCCINYSLQLNDYLNTQYFLTIDLISFRTDIIAFSLMPVLYLMGIRNNPVQLLSGVSHHIMIRYHKFVAGIFFILCVVHSVIWTHYTIHLGGGYAVWAADAYFYWGIVGTLVIGLMIAQSFSFIRSRMYEAFLFIHNAFAVLFIAAMWLHCNTLGWMGWVYSIAAIMVFDRVCRIVRIFKNGLAQTVNIEVIAHDVVKLEFDSPRVFGFFPGCYCYLTFLNMNAPWFQLFQSHPFSLVRSHNDKGKFVLYLKAKQGATKYLLNSRQRTMRVLIDGPYGIPPFDKRQNDDGFDTVLGIAGGLGVSSILAYFNERARQLQDMQQYKLVWFIRNTAHVDMIKENLEYLAQERKMNVEIYYTRGGSPEDSSVTELESDHESNLSDSEEKPLNHKCCGGSSSTSLKIVYGKPSIETILADNQEGNRRIYTCGPGKLIKDVKNFAHLGDDLVSEKHTW